MLAAEFFFCILDMAHSRPRRPRLPSIGELRLCAARRPAGNAGLNRRSSLPRGRYRPRARAPTESRSSWGTELCGPERRAVRGRRRPLGPCGSSSAARAKDRAKFTRERPTCRMASPPSARSRPLPALARDRPPVISAFDPGRTGDIVADGLGGAGPARLGGGSFSPARFGL